MAGEWRSFELRSALRTGLIPLVVDSQDPLDTLGAYATLYLEQEVQLEGLARDIGQFSRFLEAVSFSHGSPLNISGIARDAGVSRKTTEGFLSVLEVLLLAFRVPVFTKRAKRATAVHPKLYIFDAGVYRAIRPAGPLDRPQEIEGVALEGLVAQHLRAWAAYSGATADLRTWRTRTGVEVDFVLYGPEDFWAVEVKNTARVRPEDLRGLRAFREDYPESNALLLYRGTDLLKMGDVTCIPVEAFLTNLRPGKALQD
jgi:predicted AAA+ superfamily ATPase